MDVTIQPGAAAGLNTANGGDLSASQFNPLGTDWDGSILVKSNNNVDIVATNVTQWGTTGKAAISALVADAGASNILFLPAQYRLQSGGNWNQWSSVNIQNVGTTSVAAADLTVTYVDTSGNVVASFSGSSLPSNVQSGLAAGSAMGLNTRNGGDLSASAFNGFGTSFIGGVKIEGPAGSKLIATANIVYSDRASSYNGFAK